MLHQNPIDAQRVQISQCRSITCTLLWGILQRCNLRCVHTSAAMHIECAFIRMHIGVDERLMHGCETTSGSRVDERHKTTSSSRVDERHKTTSGGGFDLHLPSIRFCKLHLFCMWCHPVLHVCSAVHPLSGRKAVCLMTPVNVWVPRLCKCKVPPMLLPCTQYVRTCTDRDIVEAHCYVVIIHFPL